MTESAVIEKLKKLLAMSEGGANENESMLAAEKLQALLAKYNISMAQLDETEQDEIHEESFEEKVTPWRRTIAGAIARLYFCEFYYYRLGKGKKAHFVFVGTETNRTFALHIFRNIIKAIDNGSRSECKAHYGRSVGHYITSYLGSAANRIQERCGTLIRRAKEGKLQSEDGEYLPALVGLYDRQQMIVGEYIAAKHPNIRTKSCNTQIRNGAGNEAGNSAGNRVQLSRSLQANSGPRMIGR